MIFFAHLRDEEDFEETDDTEASLDDEVLAEIGDESEEETDETEGFGLIDDDAEEEEAEEEESDDDDSLEDDAEDVDYDTFDDIDEM